MPYSSMPTHHDFGDPAPPVLFLYRHFHDAIRAELSSLSAAARLLSSADSSTSNASEFADASACDQANDQIQSRAGSTQEEALQSRLSVISARYVFLSQVHSYHSSVEDEVVYPALEAKVCHVLMRCH
jgi:zinc finger-like protein